MFARAPAGCKTAGALTFAIPELDIYHYWNRFLSQHYLIVFYEVVSLFLGNTAIPYYEGGDYIFKSWRKKIQKLD